MEKDTNAKTFATFKKEIADRQYKSTNANQTERNKAAEICSEDNRRTPILTSAKLHSTVEGVGVGTVKYEEQRKELESSKTNMEGCTEENVNVKREIQEIRVSSGTINEIQGIRVSSGTYQLRKFYWVFRIEFQFR